MTIGKEFTRKKVIYIAGPYRDKRGEYWVRRNIQRAEDVALSVWFAGAVAICPHKNTAGLGGASLMKDEVWLEGDLELILRSDAVYAMDTWELSKGAKAEVWLAKVNNIPVLYDRQDLKEFLREEVDDVPNL